MSSHSGLLVDRSVNLLFREVVGYLNTATRRPAVFPSRVLYGCALPDHSRKLQAQKNRRLSGTVSPLVEVCSAPGKECSDDHVARSTTMPQCLTGESSALPSVARLANSSAVCSRLIRGVGLYRSRMRMSTELHRSLTFPRKRHGAASACLLRAAVTCAVASRLRSSSSARPSCIARSAAVGVASLGAGLRSSSRRRVRVASRVAVQRRVAVRSVGPGLYPARLLRPALLPNNSFEPTLETHAVSLRVGSGAAQLNR